MLFSITTTRLDIEEMDGWTELCHIYEFHYPLNWVKLVVGISNGYPYFTLRSPDEGMTWFDDSKVEDE